jgi:hypothetical protein
MVTTRRVVLLLRVLLVAAFLAVGLLMVMSVPGALAYEAEQDPDLGGWRWVLLAIFELELLCAQVVIGCTWMLCGMVQRDRIFSHDAFRWVDGILAALGTAWVVWAGFSLQIVWGADDPGAPLLLAIMLLGGAVFILLMVVMRALLKQATTLRSDLEGVI